jgi:hypothetical protein
VARDIAESSFRAAWIYAVIIWAVLCDPITGEWVRKATFSNFDSAGFAFNTEDVKGQFRLQKAYHEGPYLSREAAFE